MILCVMWTVWIVLAFVLNSVLDEFAGFITDIPEGVLASDSLRNQGGIIVVVVTILVLIWMYAASFMRERQEVPVPF